MIGCFFGWQLSLSQMPNLSIPLTSYEPGLSELAWTANASSCSLSVAASPCDFSLPPAVSSVLASLTPSVGSSVILIGNSVETWRPDAGVILMFAIRSAPALPSALSIVSVPSSACSWNRDSSVGAPPARNLLRRRR